MKGVEVIAIDVISTVSTITFLSDPFAHVCTVIEGVNVCLFVCFFNETVSEWSWSADEIMSVLEVV